MKKNAFLLFAAAVAIAGSGAQAAVVVSATRTGTFGAFDEITFNVTSLTGTDAATGLAVVGGVPTGGTEGASIGSLTGTFTAVGTGAVLSVPGTASGQTGWKNRISNVQGGNSFTPPRSYANFDTSISSASTRNPDAGTSTTGTPTSFSSDWGILGDTSTRLRPVDTTTGAEDDGLDETILAQIYVTPGLDVSFSGSVGTYGGISLLNFTSAVAVPEPTTLGLVGVASAGLLARRRKP